MRLRTILYACLLCCSPALLHGQLIDAPSSVAALHGVATDQDTALIPAAKIAIDGVSPQDHLDIVADERGSFQIGRLRTGIAYHLTVSAPGFADWKSQPLTLLPGQDLEISDIRLVVANVETAVSAVFADELALEQVKNEEGQRVFGILPNFYVVYDQTFVPLAPKLKYKLALRAITDPINLGAAGFLGALNQASDTPNYKQGWNGYGQRVGAVYANGISDILIGGAVLPALLHQDPRYFYQGVGTKKSRTLHALSSPFICKGDNGHRQFNYSSVGGDLASGALSNLYYPDSNRGPGLVFNNALVTTGGRMVNALAQEFLLSRFTTKPKR